jgi:hypothetical protein
MIKIRMATAIVAAFVTVSTNGYGASLEQIRQLPWTDDSATSLAVALPDKSAVTQFVRDLLSHSDQFEFANVGEYQILDLERSGILSLVCTLDFGGRSLHTMILVVTRRGNEFIHDQVESNGWEIDGLEQRIVDLRNDGNKEVLVTRVDGQYRGARPTPTFTDVFKVKGGRLVKADHEFPEYYEKTVLPDLRKKLDGLEKQQPSQDSLVENNRQEEIATLQHHIAAVSQILGR